MLIDCLSFSYADLIHSKGKLASGTRQLLRLHYALEFILEFMRQLRHSDEHAKTSHLASEVSQKSDQHDNNSLVSLYFLCMIDQPTSGHKNAEIECIAGAGASIDMQRRRRT